MKKLVVITIVIAIALGIVCGIAFAKEFTDIGATHWAMAYVDDLSNKGIINGYEDGSFKPSGTITRAEFIKLIVSAVSDDQELDNYVKENMGKTKDWYDGYAAYAIILKLITPYTDAEYKEPMPRIEMAQILYKACKNKNIIKEERDVELSETEIANQYKIKAAYELGFLGSMDLDENEVESALSKLKKNDNKKLSSKMLELQNSDSNKNMELIQNELDELAKLSELDKLLDVSSGDVSGDTNQQEFVNPNLAFKDIQNVHPDVQNEIKKISELGLIKGYEDGTFRPDNSLTRAEVATVIYRFINLGKGE
ncbi:MAG: S-layer homology domain-containing protein [Clostridia bacterium]|nr:S-layer homology domain-containing protein [Clostridia bacterium]